MRIEQAAEQTDAVLLDTAAMEIEQPSPDVSLKKANKVDGEVDHANLNGSLENGVSDVTDVDMEECESEQGTEATDSRKPTEPVTNGHSEENRDEKDIDDNHFHDEREDKTLCDSSELQEESDTASKNSLSLDNKDTGHQNDFSQDVKKNENLANETPSGQNETSESSSPGPNEKPDLSPGQSEKAESSSAQYEKPEKTDKKVINEADFTPRRSQRANKGPGVDYESLVEAAAAQKKNTPNVEPADIKAKMTEPKQPAAKPTKVSKLRIDDRKVPEEMEHMRAMAKLVYGIGLDMAKQMVYKDLVRVQNKRETMGILNKKEEEQLVKLKNRHEELRDSNKAYTTESKILCTMPGCEFKTDSIHTLEHHKEQPHRTLHNDLLCSFCSFSTTTATPVFFVQHMEEEHKRKAHDYYTLSKYQCNMCSHDAFHKNGLLKHKLKCEKRFNLKRNLNPFYDVCDIPIKKMFVTKPPPPAASTQAVRPVKPAPPPPNVSKISDKQFQQLQKQKEKLQKQQQQQQQKLLIQQQKLLQQQQKLQQQQQQQALAAGRPVPAMPLVTQQQLMPTVPTGFAGQAVPQTYAIGGNMYTLVNNNGQYMLQPIQQPPRPQGFPGAGMTTVPGQPQERPAVPSVPKPQPPAATVPSPAVKTSPSGLEICEICGGFVKDRMSLRTHFYWAHKIDIRKDVFSRKNPSLSCEQCPDRFWTFQGYDRHRKIAHKNGKAEAVKSPKTDVICPLCRTKATHILNHLLSVHNVSVTTALEKRQCTICLISFPTVQEVEEHLIFLHGFSFLQNMDITNTLKARHPVAKKQSPGKAGQGAPVPVGLFANNKKFDPTCTICNISFSRVQDFTNHCNKFHIFKCYRCGIRWNSYSLLVRHLSDAHMHAQDLCIICKGKFTAGIPFIQHMLTSHIKGLSIRLKRLSKSTIDHYTKRGQRSRAVSLLRPLKNCRVDIINIDSSPSKKPEEGKATQSPTKQPIILKIDDSEENETIEIHENVDE